jgi:hypothetical protein
MTHTPDEWTVVEYTREVLADIRQRLKAGATGPGATLDAAECTKVLATLTDPPFPNSRPPDLDAECTDAGIYIDCVLRQRGMPRAQAVAETAKYFRVSKWRVNAVLRDRFQLRK